MVLAQEEARLLGHNYIGTEHLFLGLTHEGQGVAAEALESFGLLLSARSATRSRSRSAPEGRRLQEPCR